MGPLPHAGGAGGEAGAGAGVRPRLGLQVMAMLQVVKGL